VTRAEQIRAEQIRADETRPETSTAGTEIQIPAQPSVTRTAGEAEEAGGIDFEPAVLVAGLELQPKRECGVAYFAAVRRIVLALKGDDRFAESIVSVRVPIRIVAHHGAAVAESLGLTNPPGALRNRLIGVGYVGLRKKGKQ
jgi:hypothetical protein